jgi:hypothetical protein
VESGWATSLDRQSSTKCTPPVEKFSMSLTTGIISPPNVTRRGSCSPGTHIIRKTIRSPASVASWKIQVLVNHRSFESISRASII